MKISNKLNVQVIAEVGVNHNGNLTLAKNKTKVCCNRSMVKKTFLSKGIDYASELALLNVKDLSVILRWNVANNINFLEFLLICFLGLLITNYLNFLNTI